MLNLKFSDLEFYLFVQKGMDRSQWSNYKSRYTALYTYFINKPFDKKGIGEFLDHIKKIRTSSTHNSYFTALLHICRFLNLDYMKNFKAPKITYRKKNVLDNDEMKRYLEVAYKKSYRYALACEIAMRSGLRIGELINAKWSNLVGNRLILTDTKSGGPQEVYFTDDIVEKIHKLEHRKRGYIFEGYQGLMSNTQLNLFVKNILKEAGIKKFMTFHDFRHTAATTLVKANVNMYIIKNYMRHKHITTTEKYFHINSDQLIDAAKKHSLYSSKV